MSGRERYMVNERGREEASAGARCVIKTFLEFYVWLATQFSLRRRQIRRRGARRYVPMNITALTAPFICVFKFKSSDVVF